MEIDPINIKTGMRRLLALAAAILWLVTCVGTLAFATPTEAKTKRRVIPVTINKGQNYTISGVKAGTNPSSKVVKNPNALVIQNAPGRVELVGADSGVWKINLTLASGEKVTYQVTVKAITPPQGTLRPTTAPTAIP